MSRAWLASVFLTLVAMSLAPAAWGDVSPQLLRQWQAFTAAANKRDCDGGGRLAETMAKTPGFKDLPSEARTAMWTFVVGCDLAFEQNKLTAFDDVRRGTSLPDVGGSLWDLRVRLGAALGKSDDVVEAVETMADRQPVALQAVNLGTLRTFAHNETAAHHVELMRRFYGALERANYVPRDATQSADPFWLGAARLAADAGETEHATALLRRLTTVGPLIMAKLDGRFSAEVAAEPDRFDPVAAAQRQLAHDDALVQSEPGALAAIRNVVRDNEVLGRFDDALALTESALERVERAPKSAPEFADQAEQTRWSLEEKANLLLRLGRFDEAVTAMRAATKFAEEGGPNISQTIDLASMLNNVGRPIDALAELAALGSKSASSYGLAIVHSDRACADSQLGHTADMDKELAYLDAHERDDQGARRWALLCAHHLDDVAAAMVAELNDPDEREAELLDLSDFTLQGAMTPVDKALIDTEASLRARPDVQAAIAKVGHTERIPLCQCGFTTVAY